MSPYPPTEKELERYIQLQLDRIADKQDELFKEMTAIKVQVGQLQVKSGIWGALSGAAAGVASLLLLKGK